MQKEIAVEVRHVSKKYNTYRREFHRFVEAVTFRNMHQEFVALEDVNLSVYRGECVGIIGTNGSGKSTLLKMITGVLSPTSGEIQVKGNISSLLELGAGFNMNYTGLENVYLNGKILGIPEEEMKKRVPQIAQFAGIGDFIYQPVRKYSSGMFARLAFAVAINVNPDVLIVDEALSVGDIFFQNKCYHKFDEFRQAGKTILFVSHDLNSVIRYCDRCLLLHHGKQLALGDCKDVVDQYRKIMVEHSQAETQKALAVPPAAQEAGPAGGPSGLWKTAMLLNPEVQDYGDKRVEIIDFGIVNPRGDLSGMILKGETYTVQVRFRINRPVEQPIFAFTIRDQKGTELCGTNTLYEDMLLEDPQPGLTGVVRFTQRMTLQGGQYMLSLGATGYIDGELTAFHRLYDVCHLHVLADHNTVGLFDVESTITYAELKREGGPVHA